jgi:hypothetical protein
LGASGNGKRKRANNTFFSAVGRDKVLRTVQYFSRFYAWYLFRTNNPQSAIDPFDQTKKQLGLTRKILRVGKFIEHFKAAATAADAKVIDPVLRYLSVARQLGYAGYLALDSLTVVRYTFFFWFWFHSAEKLIGLRASIAGCCRHQEMGGRQNPPERGLPILVLRSSVQCHLRHLYTLQVASTARNRRQEGRRGCC